MTDQPEHEILHRELDTGADNPAIQIATAVADIEGKESAELPGMYDCVDGVLDHLFSNPPAPEAQVQVEFSYGSYRITVEQNGNTKFMKIE